MLETCPECTCRFAVGLLRCPQCQAPAPRFADRMKEEDSVSPRITVAAGPTNASAGPGEPGYIEGSEPSSPGTSSSTSGAKPEPNGNETPTSSGRRPHAHTTENPSSPDPRPNPERSSASTTDGSTPATGSGRNRRRASSTASQKDQGATEGSRKAK